LRGLPQRERGRTAGVGHWLGHVGGKPHRERRTTEGARRRWHGGEGGGRGTSETTGWRHGTEGRQGPGRSPRLVYTAQGGGRLRHLWAHCGHKRGGIRWEASNGIGPSTRRRPGDEEAAGHSRPFNQQEARSGGLLGGGTGCGVKRENMSGKSTAGNRVRGGAAVVGALRAPDDSHPTPLVG